jgi:hypothetical protein
MSSPKHRQLSSMVTVTERIESGHTTHIIVWSYDGDRNTHLTPKLGRRTGKNHSESQIHSLEKGMLASAAHQAAVANGFRAHREWLRALKEQLGELTPRTQIWVDSQGVKHSTIKQKGAK